MSNKLKYILLILFFASLTIYSVAVYFHAKKPVMFDEVLNCKAAKMILVTGRPVIYYWNYGYRPWITIVGHTALYINLLALFYGLFGTNDLSGYLLGIINAFASLILVILIIRALIEEKEKRFTASVLAACLFLINPLLVRGSIMIDIETTILMTSILFFVYLAIKAFKFFEKRYMLYLIFAFSICLWSKETIAFLLIPATFFYLLLSDSRKDLSIWIKWIKVFLFGFLIAAITWWLYCKVFNLPYLLPVEYTILGRAKAPINSSWISRAGSLRNHIFWLSPFFVILSLSSFLERGRGFLERKKTEPIDFILLVGVWVFVFYTIIMPTTVNPKYIVVLVPIFSILISITIYNLLARLHKKVMFLFLGLMVIFPIYYFKIIPDPLIFLLNKDVSAGYFNNFTFFNKLNLVLVYLAPLFFLTLMFIKVKKLNLSSSLILSACILFISASIPLVFTQALSKYATFYDYGERGYEETIKFIKNNIDKNEVLFARKDIEYYVPNRIFYDRTGFTTILSSLLNAKKVSYVVFSDYFEGDKGISIRLEKIFNRIFHSGNFSIYKVNLEKTTTQF